jgi:hypothetical protein
VPEHQPNTTLFATSHRCAAYSALRSAPGASSPQNVWVWPFAAAVRTLRRPRPAGEAHPAAPLLYDGAHPLHPVRVASGGLWMARPKREFT